MREILILAIHLLVTFANLVRPGGNGSNTAAERLLRGAKAKGRFWPHRVSPRSNSSRPQPDTERGMNSVDQQTGEDRLRQQQVG
jgi:hypothetical protein